MPFARLTFVLVALECACSSSSNQVAPLPDAQGAIDASSEATAPDSPFQDSPGESSECTMPMEAAAACPYKAGAHVSETLGSCARTGNALPFEHIVFLMQENRSFDHYLGHLKGNGQDDVDVAPAGATNPAADGG